MNTPLPPKSDLYRYRFHWISLLLLGIFMVFFRIGAESLWYDESYSAATSNFSMPEIVSMMTEDSHPPLYYLLLRAFVLVIGNSETALRSLSAVSILCLAGIGFFPLRRLWGSPASLAFSFMILITPMSIVCAHEARMYSLLAFLVTAMVVAGHYALSKNSRKHWVIFSLFTLAAAWTHYFGLIAAAIFWCLVLIKRIFDAKPGNRIAALKPALITAIITVAGYTPWLVFLYRQTVRVSENFWIPPVTFTSAINILTYPFLQKFPYGINSRAVLLYVAVVLAAGIGIFRAYRSKKEYRFLPLSALIVYILTFATGIILSIVIRPIFAERYLVSCMGLFLLAGAALMSTFKSRRFIILLVVLYAIGVTPMLQKVYKEEINGPMKEVHNALADRIGPNDIFVHGSEHTLGTFSYYFPGHIQYLYQPKDFLAFGNHAVFGPDFEVGSDVTKYAEVPVTIWAIGRPGEYYNTPWATLTTAPNRRMAGGIQMFHKDPGWFRVQVREVLYDPTFD